MLLNTNLETVFFTYKKEDWKHIVLAYEPVWAIGTGETASPEQAQEMHAFIRNLIQKVYGTDVAENVSILYGGSVKPDNAKEIFSKPDVDGGLIGGAALNANDFFGIIKGHIISQKEIILDAYFVSHNYVKISFRFSKSKALHFTNVRVANLASSLSQFSYSIL